LSTTELSGSQSADSAYPNPFSENVNFKFTNLVEEVTIRFYNLEGKFLDAQQIAPATIHYEWLNGGKENVILYEIVGSKENHKGKLTWD